MRTNGPLVNESHQFAYNPALTETKVAGSEKEEMGTRTIPDSTRIPNWLFPMLGSVIGFLVVSLFTFAYISLKDDLANARAFYQTQIKSLTDEQAIERTWMQHTREELIQHGWTVDEQGNIHAPGKGR